jgi:hypothetical protein
VVIDSSRVRASAVHSQSPRESRQEQTAVRAMFLRGCSLVAWTRYDKLFSGIVVPESALAAH